MIGTSLIVIALCSASMAGQPRATSAPVTQSPDAVIKEFYQWYIHVNYHEIDPLKEGRATLKKYVTQRFIREMDRNEKLPEGEGFDADYFLQTQDMIPGPISDMKEGDWLKSMSVSKVAVKGGTATAIVSFFKGYPRVGVSLMKEAGRWKINKVTNKATNK